MILKKKYLFLYYYYIFSLIAGFYYGEDSLGAAFTDYQALKYINEKFYDDFLVSLLNYNDLGHRQSPFLYILGSIIFDFGELGRRLFFLHVYLFIPIYFYKCLKIKFREFSKDYLKLFASIILIFQTFRSYSIWTDPHLWDSVFYYFNILFLKIYDKCKPFKNALLNTFSSCSIVAPILVFL